MIAKKYYLYSLLSGFLFALTWNSFLPAFSLFIAFMPLLYLIQYKKVSTLSLFESSFIAFFIFHLFTVGWIYKSSIGGFIAVISINSFLMATVMLLANFTRKVFGKFAGYWAVLVFWMSFESIHDEWDLQWPFMNLGNWLGQIPELIQWYEYTGVQGGSVWILLLNIFFLELYIAWRDKKTKDLIINLIFTSILIFFPLGVSFFLAEKISPEGKELKALIIQPNINPYTEKYDTSLYKKQIAAQINMATGNLDSTINLLIFPETSFPLYLNKDSLNSDENLLKLQNICKNYPQLSIIAGLYTYEIIESDTLYYNTAVFINDSEKFITHDKSKLVPGVERTPFIRIFNIFKNVNVDFGGINSSLQTGNEQMLFIKDSLKIAPLICYESIFGNYSAKFVKQGANVIVVITNDAWWGNTSAYAQIAMHSKLRAIETRKPIIRAANTGISGVINEKGVFTLQIPKNRQVVIKASFTTNNPQTFYVQHGNIIGRISLFMAVILLVAGYVRSRIN